MDEKHAIAEFWKAVRENSEQKDFAKDSPENSPIQRYFYESAEKNDGTARI